MHVIVQMKSVASELNACRQAQLSEPSFVKALFRLVQAFEPYPQAWQEIEECWAVYGIDEAALRSYSAAQDIPDIAARGRIIQALEGYLKALIDRMEIQAGVTSPPAGWNGKKHEFSMFDTMQQTITGPSARQISKPLAREVFRTVTETKLESISAPVFVSEAVSRKLSGTRIFAVDDVAPDTSGAFAKIEDRTPQQSAVIEPAIVVVKVMIEALSSYDGGQHEWRLVLSIFVSRFSEDIFKKLLRDSPITPAQLNEIVEHGTTESERYEKFRNVFIERMRAFLTLRLLELSKEDMKYWPDIMAMAHEYVSEKEWVGVFGSKRSETPVRGTLTNIPRSQEVSRAYRHLSAIFQKRLALPW